MPPTRALALSVIKRWDTASEGGYAEHLIRREAERHLLEPRDRAHLTSLVFGCLRNRSLLDFWLAHLLTNSSINKLRPDIRRLFQCALYDLLLQEAPPHAAVSEAVSLAPRSFRSLANAVLRRADRERSALKKLGESAPVSVRFSHPEFLVKMWAERFGTAATENILAWNNREPDIFQRTNRLHPDNPPGEIEFTKVDAPDLAALGSGQVYIQDPSTIQAPVLLAPGKGDRVLDACASPGGKTAVLAELMGNEGEIVASDVSDRRLERLSRNLECLGVSNTQTIKHDWAKTPCPDLGLFDAILLDVPCSNTGVFRRRIDARWRISPESLEEMKGLQLSIARNAATHLKPGGRLVYSTCSIEPSENGEIVAELLAQNPGWRLSASRESFPHIDATDGAFAARLDS